MRKTGVLEIRAIGAYKVIMMRIRDQNKMTVIGENKIIKLN
jgi:hypothetical protein